MPRLRAQGLLQFMPAVWSRCARRDTSHPTTNRRGVEHLANDHQGTCLILSSPVVVVIIVLAILSDATWDSTCAHLNALGY